MLHPGPAQHCSPRFRASRWWPLGSAAGRHHQRASRWRHRKGRAHRRSSQPLPFWACCPETWPCSSICFTQGWPNTIAPGLGQAAGGLWVLLLAGIVEGCSRLGHHKGRAHREAHSAGGGGRVSAAATTRWWCTANTPFQKNLHHVTLQPKGEYRILLQTMQAFGIMRRKNKVERRREATVC